MISLNTVETQSNSAAINKAITQHAKASPVIKLNEERSLFLARMESMLDRVEEELIHESRPSDETSGISRKSSVGHELERPSNSKFLEEIAQEDDEESSDDSDSADETMIATLVAEKPETMGKDIKRPVPVFHRPIHIMVDTAGVPSPSHTNITMDATMMNETMISTSIMPDYDNDDNNSTMTPILDRYRLDPDDNSIGVRVVPNKRGRHGQKEKPDEVSQQAPSKMEFYTDSEGFMSPKGLPVSVSARKTKQYRKTPYPKKQLEQSFDDENNPNQRTLTFSPASSTASFDASNPESSFSVPPLRPRSFGPTKTSASRSTASSLRTQSLPGKSTSIALPKAPDTSRTAPDVASCSRDLMEKITMAEYNMAPKVVQMQVTREEANQSIDALTDILTPKYQTRQALEFSAEEAYAALSNILDSELKSKSVLMSLCHWRRLLMYRDAGSGMVFAVNQFEQ